MSSMGTWKKLMWFAAIIGVTHVAANPVAPKIRRQDTSEGPCGNYDENQMDPANFAKMREVWLQAFGSYDGNLGANEEQAVCCADECLDVYYAGGGGADFVAADWTAAADELAEAFGDNRDYDFCGNTIGDNVYLQMRWSKGKSINGTPLPELFGDTCAGAPGFKGPP